MIRVLVADDHEMLRRGVRSLLEPGYEVCGEAATGGDAVEQALALKPDVVVIDISMPLLNGLEATRRILRALPRVEVLVLSMHDSEKLVREALDAGARGYVLKSDVGRLLLDAVASVAAHKPFFTSRASEVLLADYLKRGRSGDVPGGPGLTAREREILQLIAEGHSSKQIAIALDLGVKTVEGHRSNLMAKLGCHSVADVVRYAIRNGIVQA